MWSDNETNRDFVNFRAVADTAAEMIVQAGGRPLSMGVSGSWGVGKSSLIRLIKASLEERTDQKFVFVEFNAWLYQGYDDARAALLDVIARALLENAKGNDDLPAKAKEQAGQLGANGRTCRHGRCVSRTRVSVAWIAWSCVESLQGHDRR